MALKKFFKTASKMDWYKNTIFVITADHCSQSAIDKYKTEIGSFSIPIIIYEPGSPNFKGIDSTIVQQMDIMPTVLNMLNYDKDFISFGNNMLDTSVNHFVVNYINNTYQIVKGNFVLQYRNDKVVAIYNFEKDPLLKHNLSTQTTDNVDDMKCLLQAFIQQYNYRMINNELTIK
jgi:phosphoglycerol transferase MdoB-like AlkP superfamily enzyme